jgi:Heterokaryon incompatibility protein (HET)
MRLLNVSTFQLEESPANRIPPYAILSHTWGDDEVLFADMQKGSTEHRAGYKKLRYSCTQAAADGLGYVWLDTCCIDKSSSAELSEAINSMYRWYQKAEICYAYLADVSADVDAETTTSTFADSRWFRRGWCLQELIAPPNLVFFSADWVEVGNKSILHDILSDITGIDAGILTGVKDLESASVARRMSWASCRDTTRVEDIAYCLMGLFGVNMPMLYGEGEKAFLRLQEEIMKHSDDQSLFAWLDPAASPDSYHGLLAKSPADFINSGSVVSYSDWESRTPFSISNKGLRIDLHVSRHEGDIYVAALDCPVPPQYDGYLCIYLKRISTGDKQYVRVKPQVFGKVFTRGRIETVYVRQSVLIPGLQDVYPQHVFQLRKGPASKYHYKLISLAPFPVSDDVPKPISLHARHWGPSSMRFTFKINKGSNLLAGALLLERKDGQRLIIMFGSRTGFEVGFDVAAKSSIISKELQNSFSPHAAGVWMFLEHHQVRAETEVQIHSGVKYYLVDFFVEPVYRPESPKDKSIHGLQGQPDECSPSATVRPSRRHWKSKLLSVIS